MFKRLLIFVQLMYAGRLLNASESIETIRFAKSEHIRKYMNESADPCESFFDFACGNWKAHYPADEMLQLTNAFEIDAQEFNEKLLQQLQTVDEMDTASERKVKDFYYSCKNFTQDRSDSVDHMRRLANEFGPMPAFVGDSWQEDQFDSLQVLAEIYYKYGINIFISPRAAPNEDDHTTYVLQLLANGWFTLDYLPNIIELEKELYKTHLIMYLNLEEEFAQQTANELGDFELSLWEATYNKTNHCETSSVQELHDKYYPDFDIRRFLNISLGFMPRGEDVIDIPCYVENVIEILKKTPKKLLANYISLQTFVKFIGEIRQNECLEQTKENFVDILSYMFYRTYKLNEQEQLVEQMWQDLKSNLQMILESSDLNWFDERSRENALEKLHSMKMVVRSYKERNFDEKYSSFHVNASDYVENLKSLRTFNALKSRGELNGTLQFVDIVMELSYAMYLPANNIVIVPVSALISDFMMDPSHPKASNYGRFGFQLSHEVIHGFSGEGRHYNKLGDKTGKWGEDLENDFNERRQCLYDQYHNYTFGDMPLSQDEAQEENAADNGGLLLAYHAYRQWLENSDRTKEEIDLESLPNLTYTNKQLFFISYSQLWCSDTIGIPTRFDGSIDPHSPAKFRAFVPLTNLDAFSKEFKCPRGSPMNPIKKCRIY